MFISIIKELLEIKIADCNEIFPNVKYESSNIASQKN